MMPDEVKLLEGYLSDIRGDIRGLRSDMHSFMAGRCTLRLDNADREYDPLHVSDQGETSTEADTRNPSNGADVAPVSAVSAFSDALGEEPPALAPYRVVSESKEVATWRA